MSELLDRTTRRLGGPSAASASAVFARWEEMVGPDIAGHARPRSLHDGVLVLAVDEPAWATQLSYMTGEVRDIQLKVVGQPIVEAPFRRGRRDRS